MIMNKKTIAIVAVIGALILGVFASTATHASTRWVQQQRTHFLAQHIARDLNLTDEQRTQIKSILETERPAIQSLVHKFEQQNDQLHTKTTFDEAYVRSVAQQDQVNYADALVEREKIRSEIFAILTPDQQTKVNQMTTEFRTALEDRLANLGDGL
jgi:protein CpxP